jgi:hypothetical protein
MKYRIEVWEEQGGYLNIEAKTKLQAEKIAEEQLQEHGIDYDKLVKGVVDVDITHRDTHLL